MKPIRILQIVPNMNRGGIEQLIMNVYKKIDRSKIQFDFLMHYNKKSYFDDEIESMGGKIYRFPVREDKNFFKYYKQLSKFFKEHKEYKVIHGHMASLAFIYLGIAKKNKVPVRIIHSHGTSFLKTIKGFMKKFAFKLAKYNANLNFACSTEAGKYLFGNKRKFEIIPNAIDIKEFEFNKDIRNEYRKKLNVENKLVLGSVSRFNLQKNHSFMLKILKEIIIKEPNAMLLLIGIGELEEQIKEEVKKLKLDNNVKFLGRRDDVNFIYQAIDIFLMPSLFEGLPLVGVEAQASKLKCYFSDIITKEVKITDNSQFLSLKNSSKEWANEILKNKNYNRESVQINSNRFDINVLSKELENRYIKYYKRNFEE